MAGRRSTPRRRGLAIAAICVGLVPALLLAELALRAVSGGGGRIFVSSDVPGLIYASVPGASGVRGGDGDLAPWPVSIDARGARLDPTGDPTCADIWVFGDSYPFGWGVEDGQAWPARLGPALESAFGCRARVSNFGLPGYHLGQVEALLRHRLQTERPSHLVIHVEEFDGFPDYDFSNPFGLPRWLASSGLIRPLQVFAVARFDRSIVESQEATEAQTAVLVERVGSLGAFLATAGIPALVVIEPEVHADVRDAIRAAISPPLDLQPCDRLRFATDPHYTPAGNACVAGLVAEVVTPE